jgi:hypothetical protein
MLNHAPRCAIRLSGHYGTTIKLREAQPQPLAGAIVLACVVCVRAAFTQRIPAALAILAATIVAGVLVMAIQPGGPMRMVSRIASVVHQYCRTFGSVGKETKQLAAKRTKPLCVV